MKKVSLLILVSMILLLAFTSCDKLPPNVQDIINKIPGVHEHAWTDATCESPKTCECGETEGEALGHTWSEATCESAKTCTVCAAVEGEPNGHQWLEATCESPKTCSVCQAIEGDALGHKWTAATCDSARTCSVCKKTDGEALGHKWVDATCTTPKTCSTCNATEGTANGHTYTYACDGWCAVCYEFTNEEAAHSLSHVDAKAPTCTENGNSEYWVCEYCNVCWNNEDGTGYNCTPRDFIILAAHTYTYECDGWCAVCYEFTNEDAAHKLSHVEAVAPTCTENGNSEYWVCEYCNVCWNNEDGTGYNCTPRDFTIPASHTYTYECDGWCAVCYEFTNEDAAHKLSHVAATEPSCEANGNVEYWMCEYCGVCWDNADGIGPNCTYRDFTIPASHTYLYECDAWCAACYELTNPTASHSLTHVEAVAPTCTENGNSEYWVCEYCNVCWNNEDGTGFNCTPRDFIIPAAHTYTYACDGSCAVCYEITNPDAAHSLSHVDAKAPNCYEAGNIEYWTCEYCGGCWDNEEATGMPLNQKSVKLGVTHSNILHVEAIEPACHYTGKIEYWYCTECVSVWTDEALTQVSNIKNVILPELGGDVNHVDAVPNSCISGGNIEYWYCDTCEQVWQDEARTQLTNRLNVILPVDGAKHNLVSSIVDGVASYVCSDCDASYSVENYHNYDGSNTKYNFNANGGATISVVDGEYHVLKTGADHNDRGVQHMIYIPSSAGTDPATFTDFSCEKNASGVIAFRLKTNNTESFTLAVCKPRNSGEWTGWTTSSINLLSFGGTIVEGEAVDSITIGGGIDAVNELTTIPLESDGWTDWIDVKLFIQLSSDNTMVVHYYVNGAYYGAYERDMANPGTWDDGSAKYTIDTCKIETVYINGWTKDANTGYKLDDLVFGYTTSSHYEIDGLVHNVTEATACDKPATCTCGWVGAALEHDFSEATCTSNGQCANCSATTPRASHTLAQNGTTLSCTVCARSFTIENYLEWNGDGSDSALKNVPNGNVKLDVVDGKYEYIFKPETDTAPDFSASGTQSGNGWYEYSDQGYAGGQLQMWIPSNNRGESTFEGFTCENNSVGLISFKMKTNMARHADWDTSLTFSVGKPRNASDWGNNGSWTDDSINIFVVEEYQESGVLLKGGSNGTGMLLATIPTEDGWSKWFEVAMLITMSSDGTMNIDYYIDGVLCGSFKRDLTQKGADGRYLDPQSIEALQLSGWTYAPNTGIMFDDFYFGYTEKGHNTFDGNDHEVTPATACDKPATCTCGWVGFGLAHDFADATCTAPKTCKVCGATEGDRLPHTLVLNGITSSCSVCERSYTIESEGVHFNGENLTGTTIGSYTGTNIGNYVGGGASYNGGANKVVSEDGVWKAIQDADKVKGTDADSTSQMQLWLPQIKKGFQNFNAANGSVGVLSAKLKINLTTKDDVLSFLLHNSDGWNPVNGIRQNVLSIQPVLDANNAVTGYKAVVWVNNNTKSVNLPLELVEGSTWTDWFDLQMFFVMDAEQDIVTTHYYINGVYIASGSYNNTVDGDALSCVYINLNAWKAGSGYYMDDLTFGHSVNAHFTFDDQDHKLTETNCGEKSVCSCGWTGYTLDHTFASDCAPECSDCGLAATHPTTHANLAPVVEDGSVKYVCSDCGYCYVLDGGMLDMGDFSDATTSGLYNKTIENGKLTMLNNGKDTNAQHQFWVPGQKEAEELYDFTNANNAIGVLSFSINAKDHHNTGIEFKVNANRGTGDWGGPTNNGWSDSSVGIFKIKPTAEGATSVALTGYNGADLGSIAVTGENGWTGWMDVVVVMKLTSDNKISVDYYINGAFFKNITADMVIWTYEINSLYINGRTNGEGQGYELKDFYFGFTLNGPQKTEIPFYSKEIAAEDVTSAALKTIVASKFKQCDQCTTVNAQGGTPVYVLAEKDGAQVEALYVSRTYPWAGNEAEQFTEFRFAVNGESKEGPATISFSFDYKATGTVEKNERYNFTDLQGNQFYSDAYVQIKTATNHPLAGDNYPELSGTDLVLDGKWHTITVTFDEPLVITNILLNLYHFQGELLIANLNVVEYEAPFYTEEIAKEAVASEVLQTVVTNKIKQWDQSSAHNSHEGTPVFVKADMNGTAVTGVYFSKTTPWVGDEGEQFSEFRVNTDSSKLATSISFVYKVKGSVEKNERFTFKDLAGNAFSSDAYVQIKTPANHPLAGDNYPELSGTDFTIDGEWHTMTYTFDEPLAISNILFNFYHFQGELIIANLEVNYQA